MIYSRSGEVVSIVRVARLEDIELLDNRKPDKQDRVAVQANLYVVVAFADGERVVHHRGFLRADDGLDELVDAIVAVRLAPDDKLNIVKGQTSNEPDANRRVGR